MKRYLSVVGLVLMITFSSHALNPQTGGDGLVIGGMRQVVSLNSNWSYLQDDIKTVEELPSTKQPWVRVTLPHTWNLFDAVDQVPGYRRNAGWYRREIAIPADLGDHRFLLSFEGVNLKSIILVNGRPAGKHIGGYVGFDIDITPFLNPGTKNEILIRADNSRDINLIPSQKSDFIIYGGITRNVWLKIMPARFVSHISIRTPKVSAEAGETTCDVTLLNHGAKTGNLVVTAVILDKNNKEVGRRQIPVTITNESETVRIELPATKHPMLWSPSSPSLYRMTVELKESGKVIDRMTDRFGYRWFEFKEHGPFFLNGERLLLRGTHLHEDYAGYGMAMPDSLHRKDIAMIKELGANFVRLAHYPQAPEVYRACDELGILVWDELPWCRGGFGGDEWRAWTKRLLEEQISQNLNHPSIIIWSLGNELYWLPDFPKGDVLDSLRAMIKELNDIAHQLDPDRLTATRKFTEGADLVDVVSPSIWAGWYSGSYKSYETAISGAHKQFARFFHAEFGGDSHVGRHTESPVSGDATTTQDAWEENIKPQKIKNVSQTSDWSESYIVNLFDWSLSVSEQLSWFTGSAQWAFKDFPTPLRPENPIPYMNQKGLVDRAGNPKDAYYVFKSYWTTTPEFCYIESHTWQERSGPGGTKRLVKVYSNCADVELFLNGTSMSTRKRDIRDFPASGLRWDVDFLEGENTLIAVGYRKGKQVAADTVVVRYSYRKNQQADNIILSSERLNGGDLLITALAIDKNGQRCLDYNKRVYFSSDGSGKLCVDNGTPTGSSVIEMANGKAQIRFRPAAGTTIVECRNQDFKGSYLTVKR